MKKIIICLLLLGIAFILRSQSPTVSVSGGVNVHCQTGVQDATAESWDDYFMSVSSPNRVKSIENDKFDLGVNAGVSVIIPLAANWMFRTGADFNIKGGRAEGKYGSGSQTYPFSGGVIFMYIDLPLVIQYWLTKRFYIELGPELGFLLSAKYKENDNGTIDESTDKSDYKKTEISISGGAGYLFGNSGFGAFARYIHGLTKVDISETYYSKVRNSTGQYGFFYKFKKKKK